MKWSKAQPKVLSSTLIFSLLVIPVLSSFHTDLDRAQKLIVSTNSKQIPVKIGARDSLIYLNEVNSLLGVKDTVFIEGYGYLSGRKTFSFFSNAPNIVVKHEPYGTDSVLVPIKTRSVAQGAEALLDFPTIADMPVADYSDIQIADPKKFDQKVKELIVKYFSIGSQAHSADKVLVNYTSYTSLETGEKYLFGQVCLFISQPYVVDGKLYCHLSYKARERRQLSPAWRPSEGNSKVDNLAKKFLSNFIKALSV